jgi:hypothetical protein
VWRPTMDERESLPLYPRGAVPWLRNIMNP